MIIILDEFYRGILRRNITLKYNFSIKCFHYPIFEPNIWSFCKNKRPWLFINERGNGKNGGFYRRLFGGLK